MLSTMAVFYLFSCLSSVPLYTCTTSSLSNHLTKDISVVSTDNRFYMLKIKINGTDIKRVKMTRVIRRLLLYSEI